MEYDAFPQVCIVIYDGVRLVGRYSALGLRRANGVAVLLEMLWLLLLLLLLRGVGLRRRCHLDGALVHSLRSNRPAWRRRFLGTPPKGGTHRRVATWGGVEARGNVVRAVVVDQMGLIETRRQMAKQRERIPVT